MRSFMLGLSLSLAFIVGGVFERALVPPAHAAPIQRWKHFCSRLDTKGESLSEIGLKGWELAGVTTGYYYCFKRPLP